MACSAERPAESIRSDTATDVRGLVDDSRAAACGILASRITGFGRIAAAAAVLGPTFFSNLFQTVAILPSTLYGFLMGTLISAVLVPPLVRRINEGSQEGVRRFASAALGMMMLVLLAIGLLSMLFAPVLLRAITVSVVDPAIRHQQVRLGVPLLIMLMPQIALYGLAGAGMAVQQAYGRFALAAAAPAVENFLNIIILCSSAVIFGTGTDVSSISLPQLVFLGTGTTISVAIHAVVQWVGAYRVGIPLLPRLDWHDLGIRNVLRRGGASIGYTGLYWAAYLMVMIIAGTVPGGVAAFQIAYSFCNFPIGLTAIPLASAQLPRLSGSHQCRETSAFRAIYQDGLRLVMFAAIPAALILAAIPRTLAGAVAFGAMDTLSGLALVTACVGSLGMGVIGEAAFVLATSACYARLDTISPLYAMSLRLVIVGVGAATVRLTVPSGIDLMWVLGASVAVANLIAGAYLCRRLLRGLPATTNGSSGLGNVLIVSVVSLVPAVLLTSWLGRQMVSSYGRVAIAVSALGITMTMYLAIHFFRGSQELRLLLPVSGGRWVGRSRAIDV